MDGFFVNIGRFRPKWLKKKQLRELYHFEFSVEVSLGEDSAVDSEIREKVEELLGLWSRRCYNRYQKRVKENKNKGKR